MKAIVRQHPGLKERNKQTSQFCVAWAIRIMKLCLIALAHEYGFGKKRLDRFYDALLKETKRMLSMGQSDFNASDDNAECMDLWLEDNMRKLGFGPGEIEEKL